MSIDGRSIVTIAAQRKFAGERIVRARASARGNQVVVASQRTGDRAITVTRLSRDQQSVEARPLGEGRITGAIALSATGTRVAFDLDGRLRIWDGDHEHAAPSHADRLAGAVWIDDETLAVAAGLVWPPIRLLDHLGRERSALEPRLSEAPRHRPCLAASVETGALAFCWVWSEVAVFADVRATNEQVVLGAVSAEKSLALGVWFGSDGLSLVVAPWPDTKSSAPMVLVTGQTEVPGSLKPWIRVPCAAAVVPRDAPNRVLAAPTERPGTIVEFRLGDQPRSVAELPGRVWGLQTGNEDRSIVAWTEDTVFWLDETTSE